MYCKKRCKSSFKNLQLVIFGSIISLIGAVNRIAVTAAPQLRIEVPDAPNI
jgi:hypothetical protein